jgi:hypothetical protein
VIVHLDEELAVETVVCKPAEMALLLKLNSSEAADLLQAKLSSAPSVLLTGGLEWQCSDESGKPKAILRRVTTSAVKGASVLVYTTSAKHQVTLVVPPAIWHVNAATDRACLWPRRTSLASSRCHSAPPSSRLHSS